MQNKIPRRIIALEVEKMAHVFLAAGILAEIIASGLLKKTDGFHKILPTIFCVVYIIESVFTQYSFKYRLCDLVRCGYCRHGFDWRVVLQGKNEFNQYRRAFDYDNRHRDA